MKATIDHLYFLIKTKGVAEALAMVDIESIEDPHIKTICRTITHSMEVLEADLLDMLTVHNTTTAK